MIVANWNKGTWVEGDSLPMCSASERDEMFLVVEKWEYELPKDWQLLQTEHFSKKYNQESVNAFLKTL